MIATPPLFSGKGEAEAPGWQGFVRFKPES